MEGQVIEVLDSLQTILVPVLAVIGITGGLKGLVGKVGPFTIGAWEVPGGLVLSWAVAAAIVLIQVVMGNIAPDAGQDFGSFFTEQWGSVALLANVIRNWIKGNGS